MAKIGSMDFRTLRGSPENGAPMMGVAQFEALLSANRVFLQVAEEINKSWIDAMQEAATSSTDLTTKLCRCGSPIEAAELCNRWLSERSERMVAHGHQASELWMKLYRSATQSAEAVVGTMGEQEKASAPARSAQAA